MTCVRIIRDVEVTQAGIIRDVEVTYGEAYL